MKVRILKVSLISVALFASLTATAKPLTDNQMLTQCKTLANAQFEDVKSVRLANLKSRKNKFEAKLKVRSGDDKAVFLCTIQPNQEAVIVRIDRKAPQVALEQ